MDPLVPDGSSTAQPKRQRLGRKGWLIIAVIAAVVMALLSFFIFGSRPQQDDVYHDREGFDRSKLSDSIGDPAALISKTGGSTVTYKGEKIIQACNLLTIEELRKMDIKILPSSMTSFERTYFDGQSEGKLYSFPTSLASGEDSNMCGYPLNEQRSTIDIDIYQPAYSQPSAIDYELSSFERRGSLEGFARFERTVEDSTYYLMRDGDSALQVYLRKISDKNLADKIVSTITKNYKREKAAPAGPVQFAYGSPIFERGYLNGCDVTKAADVKRIFSADTAPLVTERVATATGVVHYSTQEESERFAYIDHTCVRKAVSKSGFGDRQSFTIETMSFTKEEAAKLQMASGRQLDDKVAEISQKVGDDSYFSYTTGDNPEMTIRKGRFIMNISMYDQAQPDIDDQQMIQALTPVAADVINRVKDFK